MHRQRMWVILTLIWLFCSGSHANEETILHCDEQNVQDAVALVLLAHNKGLSEGNQLALYQILEAAKAQNESREFLSVHFTARESDCAAGGNKTWQDCDYLKDSTSLLRHCRARLLLNETNEIITHDCSVEPPVIESLRPPCLGCPERIDVHSEDIKEPLTYSLSKANIQNEHTHHFLLKSIAWATRQVIAGFRYKLEFDMQKSNCTKEDFNQITKLCHPDTTEPAFINCNSIVDVAPWRHELPDPSVNCEPGPLDLSKIRRRPPGWSPLRNIQITEKEESSEESKEGKVTPSKSQNTSTNPEPPQPRPSNATFNCPSKTWKVFVDKIALPPLPRPPPPPPRPDSNDPVQSSFKDSDLTDVVAE